MPSPEEKASLWSILTFGWISPLLSKGYRDPLELRDMFSLAERDQSYTLSRQFSATWNRLRSRGTAPEETENSIGDVEMDVMDVGSPQFSSAGVNPSLLRTLAYAFGGPLMLGALFKLIQDVLVFAGPVILKELIGFIQDAQDGERAIGRGLYLVAILFCANVTQSVFLHQYFQRVFRTGMHLRAGISLCVYQKALRLSLSSRAGKSTGDIVTLMSIDAQKLQDLMPYLNMVWSAPLQIAISLFFLWQEIGPASMAGLCVMLLLIPLNAVIAKKLKAQQKLLMSVKDTRIKITSELFSAIKVIKLYAWELSFGKQIDGIREEELGHLRSFVLWTTLQTGLWNASPVLISLSGFATFTLAGGELDASKAFTTLALFNILRFPINMFPRVVNGLIDASVSIRRLEDFLGVTELTPMETQTHKGNDIVLDKCTFTWDDAGESVALDNVSFRIPSGSLCCIVGPTGCGKSALLQSLLGELHKSKGSCALPSSFQVAYTLQNPWIQNKSIRDNILFGLPEDTAKLDAVIAACALQPDLAMLPAGLDTEIGQRGINLSGGQKHRVALARAAYASTSFYFLDDPLSAVDAHVSRHLFQQCINGSLRGSTRLLVTNTVNVLPMADHILFLDHGRIAAQGSYRELVDSCPAFALFVEQDALAEEPEGEAEEAAVVEQPTKPVQSGRLIEEEEKAKGHVSWQVYLDYIKAIGGGGVFAVIIGGLLMSMLFDLGTNYWLALWAQEEGDDAFYYLGVYSGLSFGIVFWTYVALVVFALGSIKAARVLHHGLLHSLIHATMAWFDTTPLGRILNRFSKDQFVIDEKLFQAIHMYLRTTFTVLGVFIAISFVTPVFAACLLPLALLYNFIQNYYVASSRELMRIDSIQRSPLYSHFSETLEGGGIATIRAFNKVPQFLHTSEERVDGSMVAYYPFVSANRWLALRLECMGASIVGLAALFAVVFRNDIDPALAGLSISYALQVTQSLNWMVRMQSERETNIVSVERNLEYAQNVTHEADYHTSDDDELPQGWPQKATLEIRDLYMRYRPGLDLVLNGLSCSIADGEKVGVVGRTGAGKSSLLLALLRLVEPESGDILMDQVSVLKLGLATLRSRISIIPQDPVLFTGSLRFNLDPFSEHSDEALMEALRLACLEDHIKTLQGGLDHVVAEAGGNFSAGQRQLLCLARALLRRSRLIMMDEATSSVSNDIAKLIQTTVDTAFADCTMIVIAHRLETVMQSDRVFVMDAGRIIEQGNPQELSRDPSSAFAALLKSTQHAALE